MNVTNVKRPRGRYPVSAGVMDLVNQCVKDVESLGFKVEKIKAVWGFMCKGKLGQASYKVDGNYLSFSQAYFDLSNEELVKEFKNTIYHEIIHICGPEYRNHGVHFQRAAYIIGRAFDTVITRCYDEKTKPLVGAILNKHYSNTEGTSSSSKVVNLYTFKCTGCGTTFGRTRRSNFSEHPERYRCSKCGSKIERTDSLGYLRQKERILLKEIN